MGAKPRKGKHRAAKYAIFAISLFIVLFVVVNGALFILGLVGINIPPAQATGNNIGMTLSVPNDSFVPINGRIMTRVYDASTNQLAGTGDNYFSLPPRTVTPVAISIPMNSTGLTSDPIRVTMDYYIGAYGYVLPFPYTVSVALPPA